MWRNNNLSIVLVSLFVICLLGQAYTGWSVYNAEQRQHDQPEVSLGEFVATGEFGETVFENWESEFLQMGFAHGRGCRSRRLATCRRRNSGTNRSRTGRASFSPCSRSSSSRSGCGNGAHPSRSPSTRRIPRRSARRVRKNDVRLGPLLRRATSRPALDFKAASRPALPIAALANRDADDLRDQTLHRETDAPVLAGQRRQRTTGSTDDDCAVAFEARQCSELRIHQLACSRCSRSESARDALVSRQFPRQSLASGPEQRLHLFCWQRLRENVDQLSQQWDVRPGQQLLDLRCQLVDMRRPRGSWSLPYLPDDAVSLHRRHLNPNRAAGHTEPGRDVVRGPFARSEQRDNSAAARVEQLLSQPFSHTSVREVPCRWNERFNSLSKNAARSASC